MAWWNPVTWYKDVSGAATGVASNVKNWVVHTVKTAVDLVENDIHDVQHWAGEGLHYVAAAATHLYNDAVGGILKAITLLEGKIAASVRAITGFVRGIEQGLVADVVGAIHLAEHLYNQAVGWVDHEAARIEGIAVNGLARLGQWASREIHDTYNALYKAIVGDFIKPIEDVLHVVKKAWDWVTYFADHPFRFFHDEETGVVDWFRHLPTHALTAVKGAEFVDGLEHVAEWFGF